MTPEQKAEFEMHLTWVKLKDNLPKLSELDMRNKEHRLIYEKYYRPINTGIVYEYERTS